MYYVLRAFALFLSWLSPRAIDRLAHVMAWVVFDLCKMRRKLMLSNLQKAFPEKNEAERVEIARASVYNFALTALEFFRSIRHDISEDIDVKGIEHIRGALDRGTGVYVLCFHMGNWEAMGSKVTKAVAPAHIVVKKVGSQGVNRFVDELRDKNAFYGIKRQKKGDAFKAIQDAIESQHVVGFVMDQARPGEPKLPFFGHPAKTNTSFAAIWRRHPAPIVPGYIIRHGVNRHVVEFFPEVKPVVTDDAAADVLRHSEQFNQVVADLVSRHPEQYFWMHNRWK